MLPLSFNFNLSLSILTFTYMNYWNGIPSELLNKCMSIENIIQEIELSSGLYAMPKSLIMLSTKCNNEKKNR